MTLAEQIKNGRKKAGLKQWQVAEALGVQPSTISRYEVGNATNVIPPVEKLEMMSKLFGVTFHTECKGVSLKIETELKTYTIWKDHWPIGEINLYPWQADQANVRNQGVYFAPKKEEDE